MIGSQGVDDDENEIRPVSALLGDRRKDAGGRLWATVPWRRAGAEQGRKKQHG